MDIVGVGKKEFVDKGKEAQRKSIVLLRNEGALPLESGTKVYFEDYQKVNQKLPVPVAFTIRSMRG